MKHAFRNPSSSAQWIACDLWGEYKSAAEAAGEDYGSDSAASRRGTGMHTIMEIASDIHFSESASVDDAFDRAWEARASHVPADLLAEIGEDDREQGLVAFRAMMDLLTPEMLDNVEVELKVPLPYEPESVGHIDLAAWSPKALLIADFKFGQVAVSPNASQLRIYAAAALALLRANEQPFDIDMEVRIAIVQPALHVEALVRVYTVSEILSFIAHVNEVVAHQERGVGLRGSGSLSSCDWCPWVDRCGHRAGLVKSMMADVATPAPLSDKLIEEIARSASAFKRVVDDCVTMIKQDEERFPNWTRVNVRNARKWVATHSKQEIIDHLLDMGVKDPYTLATPKTLLDANPALAAKIDSFIADETSHIRLYPGAPKGAPKTEPR